MKQTFISAPGHVLEVGGYDVNGTVRQFFPDALSYLATDMVAGPNVDMVVNNHELDLKFRDQQFDTILCCETLEHDLDPIDTVWQLRALLKPGGHLIITAPTIGFPLHRYPVDVWRFTEDTYRLVFFATLEVLQISTLDNAAGPGISIVGIARKGMESP